MSDAVQVLIAGSDSPGANLRPLLAAERDIEVVGTVVDAQSVLAAARQLDPDIVLLDLADDNLRTAELLAEEPHPPALILLSAQPTMDHIRRAMQAGARDFLGKPVTTDDLVRSIRSVSDWELQRRGGRGGRPPEGKIVCVFSAKGGAGRTTVAVNLAIALRQLTHSPVALADCNLLYGDIGLLLNLATKRTIVDLLPNIADLSPELVDSVLVRHESGIHVLLAPTSPEMADLFAPDHVKRILRALRHDHDYVVVDTWMSFHEVMLGIFDLSSEIVLVTTLDMPSVKNIRMFLEVCDVISYPRDQVVLVLNRADSTGGLRVEEIEESIEHKFAARLASGGPLVTSAINRGIPFLLSDPEAAISKDIRHLAELLRHPEHRQGAGEALAPGTSHAAAAASRKTGLGRILPIFSEKR